MDDCDNEQGDEWPDDDDANDIMLAYTADEDAHNAGGGCAGVVLVLMVTLIALSIALR